VKSFGASWRCFTSSVIRWPPYAMPTSMILKIPSSYRCPSEAILTPMTCRRAHTLLCETKMVKPTRLDRIMHDLELLQNDADGIINADVKRYWAHRPELPSRGEEKIRLIARPAGMNINRVEALK